MKYGYMRHPDGRKALLAQLVKNNLSSPVIVFATPSGLTDEIQNEGKSEVAWARARLHLNFM